MMAAGMLGCATPGLASILIDDFDNKNPLQVVNENPPFWTKSLYNEGQLAPGWVNTCEETADGKLRLSNSATVAGKGGVYLHSPRIPAFNLWGTPLTIALTGVQVTTTGSDRLWFSISSRERERPEGTKSNCIRFAIRPGAYLDMSIRSFDGKAGADLYKSGFSLKKAVPDASDISAVSLKIDGSAVPAGGSLTWELTITVLDAEKKPVVVTDANRGPLSSLSGTLSSEQSRQLYDNWTNRDPAKPDSRDASALHFGIYRANGAPNTELTATLERLEVTATP